MADATITTAETGEYELALVADAAKEVAVNFTGRRRKVQIVQNSGTAAIYVGRATLLPKASNAVAQVTSTRPATINVAQGDSIWLISDEAATVSIIKV
jgi:hypothetical protein